MLKRIFDISLSCLLFIFSLPLFVVIAALIYVNMGNPVLFVQQRPGLHGRPFSFYKFRTMADAHDNTGELLPDGARLTPLGYFLRKYSLDELPQLFNVLRGDLSLVGPRPLLMEYLPLYNEDQTRRHEVKPGITGWAQVNGRNALSWDDKFKLDLWYVDNQSFCLDAKILVMTVLKVFKQEGINQEGRATADKFTGSGRRP